jgi:hypothetical protein
MNKNIFLLTSLSLGLGTACQDSSTQMPELEDLGAAQDLSSPADLSPSIDLAPTAPISCGSYRYCENFESYSGAITNQMVVGPWKAAVSGTGTSIQVDTVLPYSGAKALHVTVPAGDAIRATLGQTVSAGVIPGNNLFGRAMIYYSNTGTNGLPLAVHSWFFNASGMSTQEAGTVTMNLGGGGAKYQLNWHPVAPATEQSVQGGTQSPGTWHCIQWQYDGSGVTPANHAKVWDNGTLAFEVLATKAWDFATPWSSFDFGFTHYQTLANPVDIYLDDFALNDTMIPCP